MKFFSCNVGGVLGVFCEIHAGDSTKDSSGGLHIDLLPDSCAQ